VVPKFHRKNLKNVRTHTFRILILVQQRKKLLVGTYHSGSRIITNIFYNYQMVIANWARDTNY